MFDIFATWREAVNSGCVGIAGDEVCAGYYRMRAQDWLRAEVEGASECVGLSGDLASEPYDQDTVSGADCADNHDISPSSSPTPIDTWLPVAIWFDADFGTFCCLVDGFEANFVRIWPLCRSFPVSYEAYVQVAEVRQAWPDLVVEECQGADQIYGGSCSEKVNGFDLCVPEGSQSCYIRNEGSMRQAPPELSQGIDLVTGKPGPDHKRFDDVALESADLHVGTEQSGFAAGVGIEASGSVVAVSPKPASKAQIRPSSNHDALGSVAAGFGTTGSKADHDPDHALSALNPAGLGHNLSGLSTHQRLAETLSDLERDCFAWLETIGSIKTQKQADQAGSYAERFAKLEKEAEETRTSEKRPVLEQGRAIDAQWKPIVASASDGKKRMKRELEPFLIAERERLEHEARLRGDWDDAILTNPKAGLYGRKISLRASYVLSIHDEEALRDYFVNDKRFWRDKDVRHVFKKLAEADLHAGREVPGAELVQELTAA